MLEDWVAWGLPPGEFWTITPREVAVVMAGAGRRQEAEVKRQTQLIYAQAKLTAFAYHDPKKMPSYEKFFGGGSKPMTQAETFAALKAHAAVHNARLKQEGRI